ncbi:MAG TPA: DUF2339 domain-containing protein, partial [Elusimicrobiota bacterium]|nr:DUF2339 domain-containing protein [Elusimicrobiota bacterium]
MVGILGVAIVVTIFVLLIRGQDRQFTLETLRARLDRLESQVRQLQAELAHKPVSPPAAPSPSAPAMAPAAAPPAQSIYKCPACRAPQEPDSRFCDHCGVEILSARAAPGSAPGPSPAQPAQPPQAVPPANRPRPVEPVASAAAHRSATDPSRNFHFEAPTAVDWEKFMGVQLFAWLGGFALFLGAAFFVKYSIDHNLVSPFMRVMIGFIVGIGAIGGGLLLSIKPKYNVTVQTLCAAGVAILYADIFACRAVYNFIPAAAAFGLMALVTGAAFLLAVRLDAQYVAILGLIGGFLTPPLLSTGVDHPIALFGYITM